MAQEAQIVAMGGGGFSMEPDHLALDKYVLSLANRPCPKVLFLATASGDSQSYVQRFYTSFRGLPCEPTHLSLFRPHQSDLRSYLLEQNVIYVGGGSTRNLLVLWREWGLDVFLKEAWRSGVVLAGISAGSICWFQEGVTDSVEAGRLHAIRCLGFLPGSNCPHYDGEAERRPAYHRLLREGSIQPSYAADDGAALHFIGERLAHCVASRSRWKTETPIVVSLRLSSSPDNVAFTQNISNSATRGDEVKSLESSNVVTWLMISSRSAMIPQFSCDT